MKMKMKVGIKLDNTSFLSCSCSIYNHKPQ